MKAYFCDICEKRFTDVDTSIQGAIQIEQVSISCEDDPSQEYTYYDICKKCLNEITNFVYHLKKKK